MAAGLVSHNITTAAGVTFAVVSWVPDTAAPNVGAVPVAMLTDGTNIVPVTAAGLSIETGRLIGTASTGTDKGTAAWTIRQDTPSGIHASGSYTPLRSDIVGKLWINPDLALGTGAADAKTLRATIDTSQLGTLINSAVPVITGGYDWQWIDVNQTNAPLQNTTGAVGDYLDVLICVVATAANSQVMIKDGSGTARVVLPNAVGGGVGTYPVPMGKRSKLGAWQVSTATGVTVFASGKFT